MCIDAVRVSRLVKPALVVAADRVDNQRMIPGPVCCRISVPARRWAILGVDVLWQFVTAEPGVAPNPLVLVQDRNSVRHGSERKPPGLKNQVPRDPDRITCVQWII